VVRPLGRAVDPLFAAEAVADDTEDVLEVR
jgi:hypothetical protein